MSSLLKSTSEDPHSGYEQLAVQKLDGHMLCYAEWGDPDGFPIIYFHGTPGSRLEGAFYDRVAATVGFRIIAPDRPGVGGTDLTENFKITETPSDIIQLAEHLQIDDFGVIGWSSGSPHAMACAFEIPDRITFAAVLGSYSNFAEFSGAAELLRQNEQLAPTIAKSSQMLFRTLLNMMRLAEQHWPTLYMQLAQRAGSVCDKEQLADKERYSQFMQNQDEAFRQGIEGVSKDLLMQYEDWGFSLNQIKMPVHIYQGLEDRFVPWQFAKHLDEQIPLSDITYLPNLGHMFPLNDKFQSELFVRLNSYC